MDKGSGFENKYVFFSKNKERKKKGNWTPSVSLLSTADRHVSLRGTKTNYWQFCFHAVQGSVSDQTDTCRGSRIRQDSRSSWTPQPSPTVYSLGWRWWTWTSTGAKSDHSELLWAGLYHLDWTTSPCLLSPSLLLPLGHVVVLVRVFFVSLHVISVD